MFERWLSLEQRAEAGGRWRVRRGQGLDAGERRVAGRGGGLWVATLGSCAGAGRGGDGLG